ncbi:MAG: acyl-CoA dehydrogenase family protein, partial [Granulosicoccus sp.]|nr:acyl-CoA dehydrogenase family protein [Granulosicoccus sp.]
GSDLSRIRTHAQEKKGSWRISGEKIFISGGGQDLSEGILHLVLARTGKPDTGVKGLSLFLCPSHIDGTENSVAVVRLEDKLGLHASPTCHMHFADAEAALVGKEGEGLKAMFTMMNYARTDVALQGVGHASRAHQIALEYASTREQGRTSSGQAAVLTDHADVRQMLDKQANLALGGRAMCHITIARTLPGTSQELTDILASLCKVFCSEASTTAADLGIQILGGYGYLHEYGMEQIWRDARITSIYEGANGIHARALATRGFQHKETKELFVSFISSLFDDKTLADPAISQWQEESETILNSESPELEANNLMNITTNLFLQACQSRMNFDG